VPGVFGVETSSWLVACAASGWSSSLDCLAEHTTAIAVAAIWDLTASPFGAAIGKRYVHAKGAAGGRNSVECVCG
jgi:hypothetical protein